MIRIELLCITTIIIAVNSMKKKRMRTKMKMCTMRKWMMKKRRRRMALDVIERMRRYTLRLARIWIRVAY
jgi:hypothetical protein